MHAWTALVMQNPAAFRKSMAAAFQHPDAQSRIVWSRPKVRRQLDNETYTCHCGHRAESRQALAVHAYRKHGAARLMRRRVGTHDCIACLQRFPSLECCINHLVEKSLRCAIVYLAYAPLLSETEQQKSRRRISTTRG